MKWLAYDPLNEDLVPGTLLKDHKNKIIIKDKIFNLIKSDRDACIQYIEDSDAEYNAAVRPVANYSKIYWKIF